MKAAENQKQPIAVTHLQHEFGVTNEMDQELQLFLNSRTEGEALEMFRGAEREPGLEQWRRLAALCGPLTAGRSLDDSRQILSPPKAAQIHDLAHTIQAWEILEQRHRERTGEKLPQDTRLASLLSICPTHLEKGLTAQQHLFLDYAQMKAHIVTVINTPTRCLAPTMMGTLSDEDSNLHAGSHESVESEGGELHRLEIRNGKKVFTESRHEPSKRKGGGKGKIDKENVSAVDALVTSEQIAEPKLTPMEDLQNLRRKRKVSEIVRMKKQNRHKLCHWGPSIWGPLRYGQTTVKVDGDESTLETTELMPPLPLDSRFNRTETLCGKFRKPGNEDHRDEEDPFLDCWNGEQEQFDFCNKWILGHETHRSLYPM